MAGRRIIWAAWLLAAALLWLFENNAATLTLLLCSVILPVLSILLAVHRARNAKLTLSVPPNAEKGKPVEIVPDTNARLTGSIFCENRLTGERTVIRLIGGSLAVTSAHCGTLRIQAKACVEDLFGLWRSPELPCPEEFVAVRPSLFLPRVELTENTTVISDSERYSRTKPGNDPSESFAVREYLPGDPIRQIHWKLSQKTDTLMLRELGLPVVNQTLLVFRNVLAPGESVPPETADALAEVFLSVSRSLLIGECAHTAAFAEGGQYLLTEVRSDPDFLAMQSRFLTLSWEAEDGGLLRLLSETPYAHVAVFSAVFPPEAASYCRGNRVTVISPEADKHADGVYAVSFAPENCADALRRIEL